MTLLKTQMKQIFNFKRLSIKLTRKLKALWACFSLVAVNNLKHAWNIALICPEGIGWCHWSHVEQLFEKIKKKSKNKKFSPFRGQWSFLVFWDCVPIRLHKRITSYRPVRPNDWPNHAGYLFSRLIFCFKNRKKTKKKILKNLTNVNPGPFAEGNSSQPSFDPSGRLPSEGASDRLLWSTEGVDWSWAYDMYDSNSVFVALKKGITEL